MAGNAVTPPVARDLVAAVVEAIRGTPVESPCPRRFDPRHSREVGNHLPASAAGVAPDSTVVRSVSAVGTADASFDARPWRVQNKRDEPKRGALAVPLTTALRSGALARWCEQQLAGLDQVARDVARAAAARATGAIGAAPSPGPTASSSAESSTLGWRRSSSPRRPTRRCRASGRPTRLASSRSQHRPVFPDPPRRTSSGLSVGVHERGPSSRRCTPMSPC